MHAYRSHTCGQLRAKDTGETVRLSGWIHRKRDHGNLVFIDLRDHYGLTQCVLDISNPIFKLVEQTRLESVVTVTGKVVARTGDTINPRMPTGEIEVVIQDYAVQGTAEVLPLQVNSEEDYGEEIRLKHRFLDLRRDKVHRNILLRANVIASLRRRMIAQGFTEFQTPILTSSSPEGARDFLVPSRLHPGKFYALPQAPQQFKQLLMVAGFDRYFQIAPCFRDEDSRADRSPGEFYQLDFEMSFVTQEDVFQAIEPVLHGVFEEFAEDRVVSPMPFPQIPYEESMLRYGSDKPDLRNPIRITDVTEVFRGSGFGVFARLVDQGAVVRAIPARGAGNRPRSFFDKLNAWAQSEGKPGLGWMAFEKIDSRTRESDSREFNTRNYEQIKNGSRDHADGLIVGRGPVAKNLGELGTEDIRLKLGLKDGDAVFFSCDKKLAAAKFAGAVRTRLGEELGLIDPKKFEFCWIVDFPMYELNEDTNQIEFSHNPFSMPQGGLDALLNKDPLTINAFQYDIVCNGIELSSGAIRNHRAEIMYKAFEIAGYPASVVEEKFGGMLNAFKYGAPPHGGSAPGIDRIVMLLAEEKNIREVIAFPLNQRAEDLLMQAPTEVPPARLKELSIRLDLPLTKK